MKKYLGLLAVVAAAVAPIAAHAALITSLFNTGVDATGQPLANGTVPDPHYSLISVPVGSSTDTRVIDPNGGFPMNGAYFVGDNRSRWIVANNPSSDPNAGDNSPAGMYTFRTTFDLTGFDVSSASITGGWSSDNDGVSIIINGNVVSLPTSNIQFNLGFSAFSVTSGFVAGINTLDFVVHNGDPGQTTGPAGPIGLRVDMTGNANRVPEPGTLVLFAAALMAASAGAHRRRCA